MFLASLAKIGFSSSVVYEFYLAWYLTPTNLIKTLLTYKKEVVTNKAPELLYTFIKVTQQLYLYVHKDNVRCTNNFPIFLKSLIVYIFLNKNNADTTLSSLRLWFCQKACNKFNVLDLL